MLNISFDFDEVTQQVTNIKVVPKAAASVSSKEFDLEVEDNKISLTANAIEKLNVVAGDRVAINYWTVDNQTTYPIISKAEVFTDGADGLKVTKKGTFSFKGQQRTSLLKFGNLFKFTEFVDKNGDVKDNVFVLSPVEDTRETLEQEAMDEIKESVAELDSSKVESEMSEIIGEDYEDALPF